MQCITFVSILDCRIARSGMTSIYIYPLYKMCVPTRYTCSFVLTAALDNSFLGILLISMRTKTTVLMCELP